MLEVTILKVWHVGKGEVAKLIPFMQDSHVYSPECFALTEEEAQKSETLVERAFNEGWTLERLRQEHRKNIGAGSDPPQIQEYRLAEFEQLLGFCLPIWYLERFTPEESRNLEKMRRSAEKFEHDALSSLDDWGGSRGAREFLSLYWKYLELSKNNCDQRDRSVGQNLSLAEQQIRERHPNLRRSEPLKLTVTVGAAHAPERYTSIPVAIKDLTIGVSHDQETEYRLKVAEGHRQGKKFDELKRDMLAYGLIRNFRIPLEQIETMSFEELSGIVPEGMFEQLSCALQKYK